MRRRTALKTLAAAGTVGMMPAASAGPIQLHVDLEVDPSRERELVANFRTVFRPAIRKQPGFADVKLLKQRTVLAGAAPAGMPYRLLISFGTEEQRQAWVKTGDHQKAWPEIEKTLKGSKFSAVLYDPV
jgi:heme-degrading monooxygenase HmoA